MKSVFESLSNEILLIIFSYLFTYDIYRAFYHMNNIRMRQLFTSSRRSLDVRSMRYNQLTEFLKSCENGTMD